MELIWKRKTEPSQHQRRRRRRLLFFKIRPPHRLRRQVPTSLPCHLRRCWQPCLPWTCRKVPWNRTTKRHCQCCCLRGCPFRTFVMDAWKCWSSTWISWWTCRFLRLLVLASNSTPKQQKKTTNILLLLLVN